MQKHSLKILLVISSFFFLGTSCAVAAGYNTVAYSSIPGVPQQQTSIDIYPCSSSSDSLVVYIHGGGWVKGDKKNVHSMPAFFADSSVCFASANYPLLSPGERSPIDVQVEALSLLNGWLTTHVRDFVPSAASRNISIIGHSSGSHLVALMDKRLGWNANVRSLILMDSGSYDITSKIDNSSRRYRSGMSKILLLDSYPANQRQYITKKYSPASLPPVRRSPSNPLNVFIVTSKRPASLSSGQSLLSSYRSVPGYRAQLFSLPWKHEDFPRKIGVNALFSQKLLYLVRPSVR